MATGTAVVGLGMSLYQTIDGAQKAKKAERELENLQRPMATNVAEGLQVSTRGADLRREESARNLSTSVDALSEAGTRGIVGGVGRAAAVANNDNQAISADLDMQQKNIDQMVAQDNIRLQNQKQGYYMNDLSALSSQYNAGMQNKWQGLGNTVQAAGSYFNNSDFAGFTPQVNSSGAENISAAPMATNSFQMPQASTNFQIPNYLR